MAFTRMNVTKADGVACIELNQPDEFNRMPPAFWEEFPWAVKELDAGGDVRSLIIAATGKHFSAGMDLAVLNAGAPSESADAGRRGEAAQRRIGEFQDAFTALAQARMPVLAAVQGGCIGGGVDLVAACDMRYCTEDAFFCIQEVNIGLAADVGTLQRLPYLIPDGLMRELAYTGRRMYADEALRAGLVNQVFRTREAMLETVRSIAREVAAKSPLAIASTKHILDYTREHGVTQSLAYQRLWMGAVDHGGDMARYFAARKNGGAPRYDDLAPLVKG